jgi:hypothetical protein
MLYFDWLPSGWNPKPPQDLADGLIGYVVTNMITTSFLATVRTSHAFSGTNQQR